jgi:quercetin dioxygenase-like cupin family protein
MPQPSDIGIPTPASISTDELSLRTIRQTDLVAAENAFIDCRTPGSEQKLNYAIIGSGVSETEQFVNLEIPHGFQLGGAAMPPGVNNSLHMHFTAEVFIVAAGTYAFRWGREQIDGEYIGHPGDIISIPTWVFRGFTNVGGDDNFIFTILGEDETGGLIWEPNVLRQAEGHGLHLTVANRLVDTVAGDVLADDVELVEPMSSTQIALMREVTVEQMRARVTTAHDRVFSDAALLCTAVPGGGARLALVIGYGMSEDRLQEPRVHNPHGFNVAVLRADPGEGVLRHRHARSQVLIVVTGEWLVAVNETDPIEIRLGPRDTLSVPPGAWRSIVNVSDDPDAEVVVINGGDERIRLEWGPEIVRSAVATGIGRDASGYLADWDLIKHSVPAPR